MDSVLKTVLSEPEVLKKLPSGVKQLVEGSLLGAQVAGSVTEPLVSQAPETIVKTSSFLFDQRFLVTFLLLAWAIFLIVNNFVSSDTQQREKLKYVNDVLFGSYGLLPTLIIVWIGLTLVVTLVPALVNSLPKFIEILKTASEIAAKTLIKK
ncbi:MAG TPA: hypothetical protein V6C58_17410 [Allocoleopsis sp.]